MTGENAHDVIYLNKTKQKKRHKNTTTTGSEFCCINEQRGEK